MERGVEISLWKNQVWTESPLGFSVENAARFGQRELFLQAAMVRVVSFAVIWCCTFLAAGCDNSSNSSFKASISSSSEILVDISEAQAANMTKECLAKIQVGMTQEGVNSVMAPLLGPLGGTRLVLNLKEVASADVGWQHPKTGKAIIIKFKEGKVVGTSTKNIP